jgi:hypothetical protein
MVAKACAVVYMLITGCGGAAPSPTPIGNSGAHAAAAAPACPDTLAGTLADLDDSNQPVAGATVVLSSADHAVDDQDVGITDERGTFQLHRSSESTTLTVYYADLIFSAPLPRCRALMKLAIHAAATSTGEPMTLVIRP